MRGAGAASDADWGPPSMACSRWQASARKKRRPEAISEDLSQLLSTAKAPGGGRDRPPWAAHVLAAGCAAQQPRGVRDGSCRGPKSFGLGARAARLSCSLPAAVGLLRARGRRGRHTRAPPVARPSQMDWGLVLARPARRPSRARRRSQMDPPGRSRSHTHPRERKRVHARRSQNRTQCFSP